MSAAEEGSGIIRCFSIYEYIHESSPLAAVMSCSNGRKGIWISAKLTKMIPGEVLRPFNFTDEKPIIAEVVLNSETALRDVYLFTKEFPLIDELAIHRVYQITRVAFRRRLGVIVRGVVQVAVPAVPATQRAERGAGARETIDFVKPADEE